ncbi:MAG: alpha/beta fold hydrolase [Planctomycetes bacterium]|nr:alpha/beta fold hydrolase [Planctomycetota bacterium]
MITTRFVDVVVAAGHGQVERPAHLAVHIAGRGPLALLVHGFPLDHRMWLDVLHGPLAERRTLCAVDLRGHGDSPYQGDAAHTMARFADDLAAVVRALGDEPVDLAGLSMGGYVAFAFAARHPDLLRSLVLTNTRASADNDVQRQGREVSIAQVVARGRAAVVEAMLPKLLAPGADALLHARLRTMIEGTPTETIVADQRGLQQRADWCDALHGITAPTLVIAGEHDQLTPVADAEVMATGIPGARLEVIAGTAHMTPMERPDVWADAVATLWQ